MVAALRLDLKFKRTVALDGDYTCRNPRCGFQGRVRVFGEAEVDRRIRNVQGWFSGPAPLEQVPAALKTEAKKEVEQLAWANARARSANIRCPRCEQGAAPHLVFTEHAR